MKSSWASLFREEEMEKLKRKRESKKEMEEGEIDDVYDLDAWMKGMSNLFKGARWGDMDNYTDAEIEANLSKTRVVEEKVIVKPFNCDNCGVACELVSKSKYYGELCYECRVSMPEPVVVKKQKCKGCSFHIHSNPPGDFTPEQRAYCCSICQTSKGRKHGGRCEQGAC